MPKACLHWSLIGEEKRCVHLNQCWKTVHVLTNFSSSDENKSMTSVNIELSNQYSHPLVGWQSAHCWGLCWWDGKPQSALLSHTKMEGTWKISQLLLSFISSGHLSLLSTSLAKQNFTLWELCILEPGTEHRRNKNSWCLLTLAAGPCAQWNGQSQWLPESCFSKTSLWALHSLPYSSNRVFFVEVAKVVSVAWN